MGVIKDGSISGYLPSTEVFAIHYPGYPSSASRAIETLGGTEGIVKARRSPLNRLELHFRPEDPYSHPAFGDLHPSNNFLLKISKKKSSEGHRVEVSNKTSICLPEDPVNSEKSICSLQPGQQPSQTETEAVVSTNGVESRMSEEAKINLSADIVARVSEAYHFNGMADYQHVLAVHADVAWRKKRNWADMEPHFEKGGGLMDMDQEDLMILVPPLFSPKDMPDNLVLKPAANLSLKKKLEAVVQQRWEMEIEPSHSIDFNTGKIPKEVNWKKYIPKDSEQWLPQMAVSKLFEERPIWLKESMNERLCSDGLKVGDYMLRRLLFRTAYSFSNGPFLRFMIRKGYDPRTDPESRIYQRIDFRVPPPIRSYCDARTGKGLKHRWGDVCAFRVFPYKCQTSLQLFDLADDYIQQEIRKPVKQTTCTCATGWFSVDVIDNLRLRVAVRFLSVFPETGAESLLKSASQRFEKSKKMLIYKDDMKLVQVARQQQVEKEVVNDEDKEELNDVVDEEDEMEVDSEEEEEEEEEQEQEEEEEELLDGYEALNLAGEDDGISLPPCSYLDGDISKTYLQELFCSFPTNEAGGGKAPDGDTSDAEYQIYDNYSDDDDDDL